jgi:hypothetical protein
MDESKGVKWALFTFCFIGRHVKPDSADTHYVYPCQRFSTGNTLEDYNP